MKGRLPKQITAVILALVLACSLCISAFAESGHAHYKTYCAIGDSIPAGYGLVYDEDGNPVQNHGELVEGSYAQIVSDYIGAKNTYIQARDAFTTIEALRLIDPEFEEEVTSDSYLNIESYFTIVGMAGMTMDEFYEMQSKAQDQVKSADIITLNLSNNDTLSYAILKSTVDRIYTEQTGLSAPQNLNTSLLSLFSLGSIDVKGLADLLVNATAGFVDFTDRWERLITRIRELNSDCQMYCIGMYNPFTEVKLTNYSLLPIGRLADVFVDIVNLYMSTLSDSSDEYVFVDCPDTEVYDWPAITDSSFSDNFILNVHPTAKGHAYMAQQVINAIEDNYVDTGIEDDDDEVSIPTTSDIFKDVDSSQWYYEAVEFAYKNGYMAGISEDTFEPSTKLSRAMVVTILYAMSDKPETSAENSFTDINSSDWYAAPVTWASENGITAGYDDGTFRPNANVTREQLVTMLRAYAQFKGKDTSTTTDLNSYNFNDASRISFWAEENIVWGLENGIISGKGDGIIDPTGTATRAEMAQMIMKLSQYLN